MNRPAGPDPSDVIVGSWHLPAPIRRVPALVWVFAVAALVDAALRGLSLDGGLESVSRNPLLAIPLLISYVPSAGLLFMPGAVLLGRWTGFAGRAAMAGAILLATSELIALALRLIPFESVVPVQPEDLETFGGALAPVRVVEGFLYLAGLVFLLWAAVVARAGIPTSVARIVATVLIAAAGFTAVGEVWFVFQSSSIAVGFPDPFSAAITLATVLVWGLLAAVATLGRSAARDRRVGWTALAVGAALVVVARATSDLTTAAAILGFLTPSSDAPYLAFLKVTATLYPLATALVLIGLAAGLTQRPVPKSEDGDGEPAPQLESVPR